MSPAVPSGKYRVGFEVRPSSSDSTRLKHKSMGWWERCSLDPRPSNLRIFSSTLAPTPGGKFPKVAAHASVLDRSHLSFVLHGACRSCQRRFDPVYVVPRPAFWPRALRRRSHGVRSWIEARIRKRYTEIYPPRTRSC